MKSGLGEAQAGIKIAGRNINNLRYANDIILMAESEEELKGLLKEVENEKVGLKLNIQETKIMASSPVTSWQIDGETVADFIFLDSKITADGDCSHEIKRCLTPWKESYDQPRQHIKKQRHYFAKKVHLVKAIGEGNGTPLQYSCLENPMGGGAWWAAVHGVAKSWTTE